MDLPQAMPPVSPTRSIGVRGQAVLAVALCCCRPPGADLSIAASQKYFSIVGARPSLDVQPRKRKNGFQTAALCSRGVL